MYNIKTAIIGLGYVGLPWVRLFAPKYSVVRFHIDKQRVVDFTSGKGFTFEIEGCVMQPVIKIGKESSKKNKYFNLFNNRKR